MIVVVLALTPDLSWRVWPLLDERQSAAILDFTAVVDGEADRVAKRGWSAEIDDQGVAVSARAQRRVAVAGHSLDAKQRSGVENHRVEGWTEGDERTCNTARERQ